MMKTFNEFLTELYRDSLPLKVQVMGSTTNQVVLYENVKTNSFDLNQYLSSFKTRNINPGEEFLKVGEYRALIYSFGEGYLIFVFNNLTLHNRIARALDSVKDSYKLPNIGYFEEYKKSSFYTSKDKPTTNWCFPVVFDGPNKIMATLNYDGLKSFAKKVDLKKRFSISDEAWKYMLTGGV